MKVKVNLSNQTLEYMDSQPYIQGTDTRNKLSVYIEHSTVPQTEGAFNIMIAYALQNGRTTIKMANTGATQETIDGVLYDIFYFVAPKVLTSISGNFVATLILKVNTNTYKVNVLNTVLNAVDFEAFEDALDDTASEVLESLESMAGNITYLQSQVVGVLHNTDIVDNDDSDDPTKVLSARMGKVLAERIGATTSGLVNATYNESTGILTLTYENDDTYEMKIGLDATDIQAMSDDVLNDVNDDLTLYKDSVNQSLENMTETIEGLGQLQPSGTDTSTNILAFNEDKGIYIGIDTGCWYYWDGTQYVDGGTYLSNINITSIANQTLSISSLNNGGYIVQSNCTINDYPDGVVSGVDTTYIEVNETPIGWKIINLYVYDKDLFYTRWYRTSPLTDKGWKLINNTEIVTNAREWFFNYSNGQYINVIDGKIIEGYGISQETSVIVETPDYNITDYIELKDYIKISSLGISRAGQSYNIFESGINGTRKIAYYDSEKNWISTKNLANNPYTRDWISKSTGEIPANARYFRFTYEVYWIPNVEIYYDDFKYIDSKYVKKSQKEIDLFMFMGQSNMAGRGVINATWTETIPQIDSLAGFEFKAIGDPTKLSYIVGNSFGQGENVTNAIDDGNKKTGSMVNSFINEYYSLTNTTIVGVSASEGGTSISQWQPNTSRLNDAISRLNTTIAFLESNGYTIRHKYMLWCQGETDGDLGTTKEDYKSGFNNMANAMFTAGIEKIFVVRIGHYNGTGATTYNNIIEAQTELCQNNSNYILVSTDFVTMKNRGLMKDDFHYYQAGYNEVGRDSAKNTAYYVNTDKEPILYDPYYDNIYISHTFN